MLSLSSIRIVSLMGSKRPCFWRLPRLTRILFKAALLLRLLTYLQVTIRLQCWLDSLKTLKELSTRRCMHKIRIFSTAWSELGFLHKSTIYMTKVQFKAISPISLLLRSISSTTIATILATIQVKVMARTLYLWIMEESTWAENYWACLNRLRAVLLREQPPVEATRN